jgi:hypothetical protein
MKIVNIIFILFFLFSAIVQYNDPDPYVWMPIYLVGALICYQGARKKVHYSLCMPALMLYCGYALYLFFAQDGVLAWITQHNAENITQSMKAETPWIEETREFFGLLILIAAVLANLTWYRWKTASLPVSTVEAEAPANTARQP